MISACIHSVRLATVFRLFGADRQVRTDRLHRRTTIPRTASAFFLCVGMVLSPGSGTAVGRPFRAKTKVATVVDANSHRLGPVLTLTSSLATVILKVDDTQIAISVSEVGFSDSGTKPNVLFESTDCTGQPLLQAGSGSGEFLTPFSLNDPGHTIYLQDVSAAPTEVDVRSFRGSNRVCVAQDARLLVQPAYPRVDLDDYFEPPFRIK